MTQPIILPSGKIIDQKTLEKHALNEAMWGRPVSDPFTGIRFNDRTKPTAALPLKARIDLFLLQHSDKDEIKKLPRVLGTNGMHKSANVEIISCEPLNTAASSNSNERKRSLPSEVNKSSEIKKPFYGHKLPIAAVKTSNINSRTCAKTQTAPINKNYTYNIKEIEKNNAVIEEKMNKKINVNSSPTCKCCIEKIFYKLPCDHIICRKALLLLEKKECSICKTEFKNSDPLRCHL